MVEIGYIPIDFHELRLLDDLTARAAFTLMEILVLRYLGFLFLPSEMETCSMNFGGSWNVLSSRNRSRTDYDAEIQTESRIIDNRSSRIQHAVPCTETYIVVTRVLDYIYVSLFRLFKFLFHLKKR